MMFLDTDIEGIQMVIPKPSVKLESSIFFLHFSVEICENSAVLVNGNDWHLLDPH